PGGGGVVARCIENGNKVLFNYYSDLSGKGEALDYRFSGFAEVRPSTASSERHIPAAFLMTPYFNQVVSTGQSV
ncbi:MAG: hypothetical protein IPH04_21550, partial [Saprospirales bacterium]|nr:hypothetical protein [Saprospirales bacterium]